MFKRKKNKLEGGLSQSDTPNNTIELSQADKVADQTIERGAVSNDEFKKSKTINKLVYALIAVVAIFAFVYFLSSFLFSDSSKQVRETEKEKLIIKNSRPKNLVLERYEDSNEKQMENTFDDMPLLNENIKEQPEDIQEEIEFTDTHMMENEVETNRKLQGDVLFDLATNSHSSSGTGSSHQESFSSTQPVERRTASEIIHDKNRGDGLSTSMSKRLSPTITVPTKARKRADLTYLLRKGTNIGCTLNTKIVTTHPSFTRCTVSKDVYSADGKVLLVERGSEIIGEQQTSMLQGQARVFVLWTDIETPNGVSIEINSPSAGSLGESGQAAQVDRHFWQRFGGAIMLSMISDGLEIAKDRASRNDHIRYDNTSDSLEDIASIALENSINIPPTGYVNQGELVNVMVAQDIDFSTVYELIDPYI